MCELEHRQRGLALQQRRSSRLVAFITCVMLCVVRSVLSFCYRAWTAKCVVGELYWTLFKITWQQAAVNFG